MMQDMQDRELSYDLKVIRIKNHTPNQMEYTPKTTNISIVNTEKNLQDPLVSFYKFLSNMSWHMKNIC